MLHFVPSSAPHTFLPLLVPAAGQIAPARLLYACLAPSPPTHACNKSSAARAPHRRGTRQNHAARQGPRLDMALFLLPRGCACRTISLATRHRTVPASVAPLPSASYSAPTCTRSRAAHLAARLHEQHQAHQHSLFSLSLLNKALLIDSRACARNAAAMAFRGALCSAVCSARLPAADIKQTMFNDVAAICFAAPVLCLRLLSLFYLLLLFACAPAAGTGLAAQHTLCACLCAVLPRHGAWLDAFSRQSRGDAPRQACTARHIAHTCRKLFAIAASRRTRQRRRGECAFAGGGRIVAFLAVCNSRAATAA